MGNGRMRNVSDAMASPEKLLPDQPAEEGAIDARWQAIIEVSAFIEEEPEAVWEFTAKWGCHEQDDLRTAIATCLLEHLLEHHFDLIFPRVEALTNEDAHFTDTLTMCAMFGQSTVELNREPWLTLRSSLAR